MTIQQHASFDSSAAELNATSKLVKAWESKNAKNAAKAGGVSLMALSLAACSGSSNDTDGEVQINEDAGGARDLNGSVGTSASPVYLSSNRDHGEFSGMAYAGEVWSPGGDTRVDSLGNEDAITGTGTADTLEATLAADDVAPILQGIETLDVDFIGSSAGQALDLEDSNGVVNIIVGRITNNTSATVENINDVVESISVSNSGEADDFVNFSFNRDVLDGSADTLALTVNDVQVDTFSVDAEDGEGYETINMSVSGATNLDDFEIDSTVTLNITATADLTVGDFDLSAGHLTTIDASTSTADLDVDLGNANVIEARVDGSSGTDIDFTYSGSAGADYIRVDEDSLSAAQTGGEDDDGHDTIDGGAGTNTLDFTVDASADLIHNDVTVSNIQNVHIDLSGLVNANADGNESTTATLDGQQFGEVAGSADLAQVTVRNTNAIDLNNAGANAVATFNIDELDAGVVVRVQHSSADVSDDVDDTVVNVHQADGTGTADTQTIEIIAGANTSETFDFTLDIQADDADNTITADDEEVESVTIIDSDTENNTILLTSADEHDGTLTLSGGRADDTFTIDDANAVVAVTVNAQDQLSDVTIDVGAEDQDINMGSGDDNVVFITADTLTDDDDVNGGLGTDTITASFTADTNDDLNISAVEVLQIASDAAVTVDVSESDEIHTISLMSDQHEHNGVAGANLDVLEVIADNISTINLVTTVNGNADTYNGLTITDEDADNPAALTINVADAEDDSVTVGVITLDNDTTSLTINNNDDDNDTGNSTTFNGIAAAALTTLVVTDGVVDADGDAVEETIINLDDTVGLISVDASGALGGLQINIEALGDNAAINLVQSDDDGNDAQDDLDITFIGDAGADGLTITGGDNVEEITITNGDLDDLIINTAGGNDVIVLTGATGDNIEITTGAGNDTVTGTADDEEYDLGAGDDIFNQSGGGDQIVTGAGTDEYNLDAFQTTADVITDFTVGTDNIDVNVTLVDQNAAANAVVFQSAAAGVAVAATTTVFELTGATTDGTAADLVTTLAATATNATIDAGDTFLIVNYLDDASGAQVWSFVDADGANIAAGELTLQLTLSGVEADAIVTGDFI